MNGTKSSRTNRPPVSFVAMAVLVATTTAVSAQAPHLTVTQPGGMPGLPVVTSIERKGTNHVEVRWDGPSGFYRLMQKSDLTDMSWQEAGSWNTNRAALVTAMQEKAFFSVQGPSPVYAGSQACEECHPTIHATEAETRHASALETLKQIGQGNNPSCLPCHTVGYNLPTGFTTEAATPNLAGVQCENCHGPAGRHIANPFDLTVRPRIEIAAQVCGGCHTDAHHPTYDEWSTSGHAGVVEDMNGGRIDSCGRCHSGTSRLAQLNREDPTVTVEGDADIGITCAVCHDPHEKTPNRHQLRNPTHSTNYYFLTTSGSAATGGGLLDQYDPNVNICAQCHNHRGAVWNADVTNVVMLPNGSMVTNRPSTRAPHHSPQYNILLATVGEFPAGYVPRPAVHGGTRYVTNTLNQVLAVTNQCATCHMQSTEYEKGPPETAANTGHQFGVDTYGACLGCHAPTYDPVEGEALVEYFKDISAMETWSIILETKALLDEWATNYAPAAITNYGPRAWEYRPVGDLSQPANGPTLNGPTLSEQQMYIPDNIKKARFNLYMVFYDGSYGLHNGRYTRDLLRFARNWVRQEMVDPPR